MGWLIALSVVGILAVIFLLFYGILRRKKIRAGKKKEVKEPKKKQNALRNKNGKLETKPSYCDIVDKFLFRKEIKIFILISRILPKGYIVFPKIGLDTILQPVGSSELFNAVKDKTVDLVVFDQETMKPRVVVDIYDGSIGDEQLDLIDEKLVEALKSANLPVVSYKVKTDYQVDEIKKPLFKALGLDEEEENKD